MLRKQKREVLAPWERRSRSACSCKSGSGAADRSEQERQAAQKAEPSVLRKRRKNAESGKDSKKERRAVAKARGTPRTEKEARRRKRELARSFSTEESSAGKETGRIPAVHAKNGSGSPGNEKMIPKDFLRIEMMDPARLDRRFWLALLVIPFSACRFGLHAVRNTPIALRNPELHFFKTERGFARKRIR